MNSTNRGIGTFIKEETKHNYAQVLRSNSKSKVLQSKSSKVSSKKDKAKKSSAGSKYKPIELSSDCVAQRVTKLYWYYGYCT